MCTYIGTSEMYDNDSYHYELYFNTLLSKHAKVMFANMEIAPPYMENCVLNFYYYDLLS